MVFINEWLPNPVGPDAKGEFIELFNNGAAPVSMAGWKLKASGKKLFALHGQRIAGNGYLILPRSETKLTLKNTDEQLFLYNAAGTLADQSSFEGSAPEGKSWNRINYDHNDNLVQDFAWSDPTPGAANKITINMQITDNRYPINQTLNRGPFSMAMAAVIALSLAIALAGILLYAVKHDDSASQLFFGRN